MAAATEEKTEKVKQSTVKGNTKVLLFSVYPMLSLSVEKQQRDNAIDVDGRSQRIKRGRSRQVRFGESGVGLHFAEAEMRDMNDKTIDVDNGYGGLDKVVLQVGIRNMEGYGRDFFECVRTPGMDPKAFSMMELMERNERSAEALFAQAKAKNLYANASAKDQGLSSLGVSRRCVQFQLKWDKAHGND